MFRQIINLLWPNYSHNSLILDCLFNWIPYALMVSVSVITGCFLIYLVQLDFEGSQEGLYVARLVPTPKNEYNNIELCTTMKGTPIVV